MIKDRVGNEIKPGDIAVMGTVNGRAARTKIVQILEEKERQHKMGVAYFDRNGKGWALKERWTGIFNNIVVIRRATQSATRAVAGDLLEENGFNSIAEEQRLKY